MSPKMKANRTLRHDDRYRSLQRLRLLHGCLRGREQRSARRERRYRSHRHHLDPRVPIDNGDEGADRRSAFVPMLCQHCGDAPCVSVCPQQAIEVDPVTGIVGQMPERCLGCRYCMVACPYHARYFNWSDPAWPAGMEKTLNPDVAPRMRGVVEKCNFCHGRWHAAKQAGTGKGLPAYLPACAEACPTQAIRFGNLDDAAGEVAQGVAAIRTASACSNPSTPIPRFTTAPRRSGCARSPMRRAPERRQFNRG